MPAPSRARPGLSPARPGLRGLLRSRRSLAPPRASRALPVSSDRRRRGGCRRCDGCRGRLRSDRFLSHANCELQTRTVNRTKPQTTRTRTTSSPAPSPFAPPRPRRPRVPAGCTNRRGRSVLMERTLISAQHRVPFFASVTASSNRAPGRAAASPGRSSLPELGIPRDRLAIGGFLFRRPALGLVELAEVERRLEVVRDAARAPVGYSASAVAGSFRFSASSAG